MHVRTDIANEVIITWDQVGYFDQHADKLDSFQLVLRGPDYVVPAGEGQVGFFWNAMQWETGDASGGTNGFGGTPAAVGFGDGNSNGIVLAGSIQNGISGIVNDEKLWLNLDAAGVPESPVPEPSTWLLSSLGLAGLMYLGRKGSRSNSQA